MRAAALTLLAVAAVGCGGDAGPPLAPAGARIELMLSDLRALDPAREGTYSTWVVDRAGAMHAAGTIFPDAGGRAEVVLPVSDAVAFILSVEPPDDRDPAISGQRLLGGTFRGGRAELSALGSVTAGDLPLRVRPGQFTMFTPSDNHLSGYPSNEYAGVWLFNPAPRQSEQNDHWVRLTQLAEGWVYEGWAVRDIGTLGAVWLSYGKFRPDGAGVVNSRDDTGWGPFSGVLDFATAGEEEYPGDDWISNPLGYPVPGNLALPVNLQEKDAGGAARWTHVITIESARDRGEPIGSERPFLLQPYRDAFGDGRPGTAQSITFRGALPGGVATIR
ncbi:MAG: anti-sigma factor [Gemmatimonadota bacterium]|nr:anti-sigma factor [Gemmatimonadota bacterium]